MNNKVINWLYFGENDFPEFSKPVAKPAFRKDRKSKKESEQSKKAASRR